MEKVRIVIENQEQEIRKTYEGQAGEKDGVLYVFYEEEGIKHRLDIGKERAVLKKTGLRTEEMIFETGVRHPYAVQSPEGRILLDTLGKGISRRAIPSGEKITLSYELYQEEGLLGNYVVSVKILYF